MQINKKEIVDSEDFFHLSDEEWTSHKNEKWGMIGEKIITQAVKTLYKKRDGWIVDCNKFGKLSTYKMGSGMDIVVTKKSTNEMEIAIEVKNFKAQKRAYGIDFVEKQVLSRRKYKSRPALLVMTYSKLLTKKAKELLHKEGWAVLYLEKRIYHFEHWTDVYPLAEKIREAIQNAKKIHEEKIADPQTKSKVL